ncbi:MAG: DUF4249 family protein [Ignavibacteria bacterium]|nr:DUF4249 family protein [Ignavibacteria bacterium]
MKILDWVLVFFFILFWIGCDQSFNPKAPFQERLAVFSILSNDRDKQFVRVSSNYDVSAFDPSENQRDRTITGARVTITESSNAFVLRDTLLPRPDTSRYKSPIGAYVASPFRAQPGRRYKLVATSEKLGTASATVTPPDLPMITLNPGPLVLEQPDLFQKKSQFDVVVLLSPLCKGYHCQVFVDYQVLLESGWKDERVEVPTEIVVDTVGLYIVTYPELRRVQIRQTGTTYVHQAYVSTLVKVLERYPRKQVTFKRVVLRILQCEQNVYNYYNTVNGFRDPVSVRLDEPEYSNVSGGWGMFGAYTLDSLTYALPSDFTLNWR